MPNYTPKLNLKKPLASESFNIADINGNMDILDAIPMVSSSGSNTYGKWRKFTDGTFEFWGQKQDDTANCNTRIGSSDNYKTSNIRLTLPFTVATIDMMIFYGQGDFTRSSAGYGHRETEAYAGTVTNTYIDYYYVTPMNEGNYSASNLWAKNLNFYIRGTF